MSTRGQQIIPFKVICGSETFSEKYSEMIYI